MGLRTQFVFAPSSLVLYGAKRQFRRYSGMVRHGQEGVSIPSSVAEGCGHDRELRRLVHIELGSASELQYQLLLARDLSYLTSAEHDQLEARVTEIKKMLSSLVQKLTADN